MPFQEGPYSVVGTRFVQRQVRFPSNSEHTCTCRLRLLRREGIVLSRRLFATVTVASCRQRLGFRAQVSCFSSRTVLSTMCLTRGDRGSSRLPSSCRLRDPGPRLHTYCRGYKSTATTSYYVRRSAGANSIPCRFPGRAGQATRPQSLESIGTGYREASPRPVPCTYETQSTCMDRNDE